MRWDADSRSGRLRWRARRVARAAAAVCFGVPLAGCGLFSSGVTVTSPTVMTVTSEALSHNMMSTPFICGGTRTMSPPLTWTGAPAGTKSIAIVFDDANAPITPYVYWVAFDIGPGTSALIEGQLPPGTRQARGTAGYDRYDAPCPGPDQHGYRFTVYALNTVLNLPNGTSLLSAWQAIAASTIGRGGLRVYAAS